MQPSSFFLFTVVFLAGASLGLLLGILLRKNPDKEGNVRIGASNVSGRGVFALRDLRKGEIIERCPVLELDENDVGGELVNYVFYGDNASKRLVAMGNGMLFNHSSFPNVGYYLEDTPLGPELVLYALRNIRDGEELFYNYGDEWWTSREITMNS
ncbi:SET domain-containing protein-lysine N-methyltransferase [Prosthecochloris sp. HL-130-GSB]|jgi:uncharacterized protein|uniref:SET domain-containing protein-lysine N-methyltransferase n=1 Tax=Prosthecochloris aestuarii TaxID=1102 RepID=A0A831ST43_PROAE|nr:SET domain-containing protein-lysine N-methyltransferase [Prosthecochloris sp. HL-130-GSB]ARM30850.1 SET domain-containing protein-lysine N-methyltransferase [Prosthecochloris sp. HL-130-GSB]MBO8093695.1 SET domain-containing protein-lysine N-methyltransferase [Prosthecochloris sp.]HED31309.1 SET domain-containing protein-lysine N-methyltransferase [Prosthecochloris aestuarii]